jgi:putative ABC transport system substrate-binding protein
MKFLRAAIIVTLGIALPLLAVAQSGTKPARIGVLWGGDADFAVPYLEAARRAMGELGHVEGKTFVVEPRFGERKPGAVEALAADLVQRKVDVIVAAGDPAIHAARRATATIPIVMIAAGDAVRSGLVASLARPGGNLTGMTFLTSELAAKRLEILKEAVPSVSRVAVLWNPDNPGGLPEFRAVQAAAEILRLTLQSVAVRKGADLEHAFKLMTDEHAQGVLVLTEPVFSAFSGRIVAEHALKNRLPMICDLREFTRAGALMSYGPSLVYMAQRSAAFVDKILKGGRPAEIPIEQPTKFELVINLKTAKALGVTVPPSVLARADDVIE